MPETKDQATPTKELTAADVVKVVKRRTLIEDKGASRVETSPLKANEVLSFKDYGTHIVVVTNDGQKFSNADEA